MDVRAVRFASGAEVIFYVLLWRNPRGDTVSFRRRWLTDGTGRPTSWPAR
jgi:hypothetical protein